MHGCIGAVLRAQGRNAEARESYQRAFRIAQGAEAGEGAGGAGQPAAEPAAYSPSRSMFFLKADSAWTSAQQSQTQRCIEYGLDQSRRGDYDAAVASFGQVLRNQLEAAGSDESAADLAVTYERLGAAQAARGQHRAALGAYGAALRIRRVCAGSGDDPGVAGTLVSLGGVYAALGLATDALGAYTEAAPCTRLFLYKKTTNNL